MGWLVSRNLILFIIASVCGLLLFSGVAQGKKSSDPLECVLNSLSYTFPEIDVDLDGKELIISDLTCYGFDISSLPSSFQAPTTLSLAAKGLKTSCQGNYKYGILKQQVEITIDTDIALDVFVQKANEYPVYTNFSSCNVTKFDISIDFSSSILNAFAPLIASFIEKKVYSSICVTLNSVYSTNMTALLVNEIDPKMQEISSSLPSPYPDYGKHYVDWSNSTYGDLRNLIEDIRGMADIPSFLKCVLTPEEPARGLTSMLSSAFTKGPLLSHSQHKSFPEKLRDDLESFVHTPVEVLPGLSIQLTSTRFKGLDTIDDLEILAPYKNASKVILRSSIAFRNLSVELRAQVVFNASELFMGCGVYKEEVMFTFAVENNVFLVDLALPVDDHLLRSFFMDQLSGFSCWLGTVDQITLPNVDFQLGLREISLTQLHGDSKQLEEDITALLNNALLFLFSPEAFQASTEALLTGLAQGPLREAVNERLAAAISNYQSQNPCLSHYPYDDSEDLIEWPSSPFMQVFNKIVNEDIGYDGVNTIMSCATEGTGSVSFSTRFLEIELAGLDSFYGFQLFAPIFNDSQKVYNLETSLAAGYCPSTPEDGTCKPFSVKVSLNPATLMQTQSSPSSSSSSHSLGFTMPNHTLEVVLSVNNFELSVDNFIKMDMNALRELNFKQLAVSGCKASTLQSYVFETVDMNVTRADVMFRDGTIDKNVTSSIQKLLDFITRDEIVENKNADIANELTNAGPTCANNGVKPSSVEPSDSSSSDTMDWKWELFILAAGCVISLSCLLMAYHYWGKIHSSNCLGAEKEEVVDGVAVFQKLDERPLWERYALSDSLVFHRIVPLWVRVGVPLAIMGNIAIFLDSNLAPDAVSVMLSIITPDKTYPMGSVFDFGLGGTVKDMWSAKVYTLAILIAFFSGAWPYIKLAAMLIAWILPPAVLSVSSRETVLIVLDALGKWSLVDFFVMVLMLAAFYFDMFVIPQLEVKVTVQPKWGFYSFLLATMISLGLGHTILACHRLVVEPKVPDIAAEIDPKESLSSLTYEVMLEDEKEPIKEEERPTSVGSRQQSITTPIEGDALSRGVSSQGQLSEQASADGGTRKVMLVNLTKYGKLLISIMIIITMATVILGTILTTVGFEFKGLTGLLLRDDAKTDYSFATIGEDIPEHSGIPDQFAIRWMQACYFLFGMGMPLALLSVLSVLWFVPLTLDRQRQLFVLSEVLNAWSALDVYCVAIAASILEIRQFASFIIGDTCDKINVFLEKHLDKKLEGDDLCFDVVAYTTDKCWIIFLGAGLILLVGVPSLIIGHASVALRLKQSHIATLELLRRRSSTTAAADALAEKMNDEICSQTAMTEPLLTSTEKSDLENYQRRASSDLDEEVDEESKTGCSSSFPGLSKRQSASRPSQPSKGKASAPQSRWEWLRWYRIKLFLIYSFAYWHLVDVSYRVISIAHEEEEEGDLLDPSSPTLLPSLFSASSLWRH
eukprot:gene3589-3930_t